MGVIYLHKDQFLAIVLHGNRPHALTCVESREVLARKPDLRRDRIAEEMNELFEMLVGRPFLFELSRAQWGKDCISSFKILCILC